MRDEIEVGVCLSSGMTVFGEVGRAPWFQDGILMNPPVAPVILVLARDVCAALQTCGDDTYGGVTLTATRDGMFRVDSASGSWVWELFPARFSDDRPYEPPCYLAVWRD